MCLFFHNVKNSAIEELTLSLLLLQPFSLFKAFWLLLLLLYLIFRRVADWELQGRGSWEGGVRSD